MRLTRHASLAGASRARLALNIIQGNDMKAVLIDPYLQQVSDIELPAHPKLADFYKIIDCTLVELFGVGSGIVLVINEEGMLADQVSDPSGEDTMPQAYFRVAESALAGRAVMIVADDNEESGFAESGKTAADVLALLGDDLPFGWLSRDMAMGIVRGAQEDFIASVEAQGGSVERCGDFMAVASFAGDKSMGAPSVNASPPVSQ